MLTMGMLFGIIVCANKNVAKALAKEIVITVNSKEQVYNKPALTLDYTISGDELTNEEIELLNIVPIKSEGANVGSYSIIAYYSVVNGISVTTINGIYTITPADFDTRDLFFGNKTYTYDGTARNIFIEGYLPSEIEVIYASNNQAQAGEYLISAIFTSNGNYTILGGNLYATLSIEKAEINIIGMAFNDKVFTYDGTPKSLKVTGSIPDNVTIRYQGNLAQSVGSYRSTAIIDYDKNNYRLLNGEYEMVKNSIYADIIINKAKSVIKVASMMYSKVYDGTAFVIPVSVEGEDTRNIVYIINKHLGSNKFTDVGNYSVVITTIGSNNYFPAEEVTVDVKILTPFIVGKEENLDVTLLSIAGFEYGTTVLITKLDTALIDAKQNKLRKIAVVYTILLFSSGSIKEVPEGTTVVITPPDGRNLNIFFNKSGLGELVEYTYNGQNNMVFETDKLGMFVIYEDDYQLYWVVGLYATILAILCLFLIMVIYRSKKYKIDFVSNIIGYNIDTIKAGIGKDIAITNASYGSLIFSGWYLDDTLKNKLVSLQKMPNMNLKLYAKWAYRPIGKYRKFTDLDLF